MDRLLILSFLAALALSTNACTNNSIEMGGVPKWMMNGSKINSEPAALAPDPGLLDFENESGPVEFFMITDAHDYPLAPLKKGEKADEIDYERGRDYRVKSLFR
jgi:hypothetical protein